MQGIKAKADELVLMNTPVDIEDFTIKTFNSLDDYYKELVNAIHS